MCHHWRTVFGCGHFHWGSVALPCGVEIAFNSGLGQEGCSEMWSHGIRTYKTDKHCRDCILDEAKQAGQFAAIKERIKILRENLDARTPKDVQDGPGAADAGADVEDWLSSDEEEAVQVSELIDKARSDNEEAMVESAGETKDGDTPIFEVKFDPKHRPLKLSQQAQSSKST